jgi:hypothetical protein
MEGGFMQLALHVLSLLLGAFLLPFYNSRGYFLLQGVTCGRTEHLTGQTLPDCHRCAYH